MTANLTAFMKMLRFSEGTLHHPLTTNGGYDVIVTGIDGKPEVFTDYTDHPFASGRTGKVFNRNGQRSTASGAYQQLYRWWPAYKKQLGLKDFSAASQDLLCIQLLKERSALADIEAGRITSAVKKCANIWASLPGAGYGQHENDLNRLLKAYQDFGGKLTG
ncbi:glycoside hydrolase family 104 protein [Nissabacter sp. SGAir0207]|uniref:glycoside hydrolase family 24 protein n=1 Tax=Nissabacter sp. SGAir0207 TaxID=2126321 RepID=UPI0010CCB955|nr:glycoside hydrolase family 104 protein [Nissabacter sp. SGAir0207]QCR38718.1 lysozyme [Nissabacter sp. SGAir0207]